MSTRTSTLPLIEEIPLSKVSHPEEVGGLLPPASLPLASSPSASPIPPSTLNPLPSTLLPSLVFELFKDRPYSFFLDSGMDPDRLGRYSFIGSDPFLVMRSRGRNITLVDGKGERVIDGNPFDVLGELLQRYRLDFDLLSPGGRELVLRPPKELRRGGVHPLPSLSLDGRGEYTIPFPGGAVGYLSYDLCHFIERLPDRAEDDLGLPECCFAFYDAVIAFDHLENRVYVTSTGFPETGSARVDRARARLNHLKKLLTETPLESKPTQTPPPCGEANLRANFSHDGYLEAVQKAREYICSGDIFQVNLSQRFEADMPLHPYELYRRLRQINPAPFACYLNFDGLAVVSASPERFLRLHDGHVETRPIKGTRPRGKSASEDTALASELARSAKDQAEHVMIVDLERNDLGRVCRYGSVTVSELAALEKYATVFHLTSTVEGQLRPDKNAIDLLRATFPGGSITGAPKVRAMEIIDELEPTRRSVYTGSIGYLGFDGNLDLNIAIRTILVKGGKAWFQVGGGIVYDSDPEKEYQETLDKAEALIQALGVGTDCPASRLPNIGECRGASPLPGAWGVSPGRRRQGMRQGSPEGLPLAGVTGGVPLFPQTPSPSQGLVSQMPPVPKVGELYQKSQLGLL